MQKTPSTPTKNSEYANQNSKYGQYWFMLFCRDAIFVANLRTFLVYHLQTKKRGGVQKTTNMRYGKVVLLMKIELLSIVSEHWLAYRGQHQRSYCIYRNINFLTWALCLLYGLCLFICFCILGQGLARCRLPLGVYGDHHYPTTL